MKHLNLFSWRDVSRTLAMTVGSPSAHRRGTMLKLISVLVLILTLGVGQMWGAPSVVSYNESTKDTETSVTSSNITSGTAGRVSWSATGATWNSKKSRWDIAVDGTITFSVSSGYQITQIVFTTTSNKGTFSVSPTATITGNGSSPCTISGLSASSVTVTVSGQTHMINSSVTVTYEEASSSKTLSSISVQTAPTKKKYVAGEMFDPTGLVITRTYSDATSDTYAYAGHTSDFTFSPTTSTALTTSNTSVSITYGGKSTSQAISVYNVTLQARDEDGGTISSGPGAPTRSGATITAAANSGNYVFKRWVVTNATAASTTTSPTTLSNPTGAVTVTAEYYKPITITYKANGTTFTTQTYGYGGTLAFPSTNPDGASYSCSGKTFVGWVGEANKNYSHASTEPTYVTAGGSVTTAATYYAVFADADEDEGGAANSITTLASGTYYLVDTYDGKYFSPSGTGSTVTSVDISAAVTANNDGTISIDATNNVITAAMQYTVTVGNSTTTVQNVSNSSYIGGNSSTSFNTASNNQWTVSKHSTAGRFTFVYSSRCILYRSGYDFRNYSTSNRDASGYGTGYLYLVPTSGGSTTVYSNYATTCCQPLGTINGSFFVSNQ